MEESMRGSSLMASLMDKVKSWTHLEISSNKELISTMYSYKVVEKGC